MKKNTFKVKNIITTSTPGAVAQSLAIWAKAYIFCKFVRFEAAFAKISIATVLMIFI